MKFSVNSLCSCGSKQKYKKCCLNFHKGANAKDALSLMKSRYSAYVVGDAKYIKKTTHKSSPYFHDDIKEIEKFSKSEEFLGLEIVEFVKGESEAYVTFKALLGSGELYEKSRFLKEDGVWFYVSGEFL